MLICDLVLEVRASRSLSADQVARLEREIFAGSGPSQDALAALSLIDGYARRADPAWAALLARAAKAGLLPVDPTLTPERMDVRRAA